MTESSAFRGTILNAQIKFGDSPDSNSDTKALKEIKTEIINVGKILKNVVLKSAGSKNQQVFNITNDNSLGGKSSSERLDEENRKSISQKVDFTTSMAGGIGGNSSSERLDELLQDNAARNGLLDKLLDSVDDVSTTIVLTSQAIIQAIENIKCAGESSVTGMPPIEKPKVKPTDKIKTGEKPGTKAAQPSLETKGMAKPGVGTRLSGLGKAGAILGAAATVGVAAYTMVGDNNQEVPQNKEKIGYDPSYSPYDHKNEEPVGTFDPNKKPDAPLIIDRAPAPYVYSDEIVRAYVPIKRTLPKKPVGRPIEEAFPVPPMADAPPPPLIEEPITVTPLDNSDKIKEYQEQLKIEEEKLKKMDEDAPLENLSTVGEEVGTPINVTAEIIQLDNSVVDLQEKIDNNESIPSTDIPPIRLRDPRLLAFRDKWTTLLDGATSQKEKKEIYKQMMAAKAKLNSELERERISGNLHETVISNASMIRIDAERYKAQQKKKPKTVKQPLKDWLPLENKPKPVEKVKDWSLGGMFDGIKDSMRKNRENVEKNKSIVIPKKEEKKTSIHFDPKYNYMDDLENKKNFKKVKYKDMTPLYQKGVMPTKGIHFDPEARARLLEHDKKPLTPEELKAIELNRELYNSSGRLRTPEELEEYRQNLKPKNMSLLNQPIGENIYENSLAAAKSENIKIADSSGGTSIVNAPTTINNSHSHSNMQSPIRNQESSLSKYMSSRYA